MFGATCKVGQLVFKTFFVLLVHTWTMIVRKNIGIVLINSCCPFHSLIVRGGCTLRWLKNGTSIHPYESTRTNLRPVMWQMAPTPIGGVRRFVSNQIKPYLYNMDNVMPCQTLKLSCQHIKFNKTICWDFFGTKSI